MTSVYVHSSEDTIHTLRMRLEQAERRGETDGNIMETLNQKVSVHVHVMMRCDVVHVHVCDMTCTCMQNTKLTQDLMESYQMKIKLDAKIGEHAHAHVMLCDVVAHHIITSSHLISSHHMSSHSRTRT